MSQPPKTNNGAKNGTSITRVNVMPVNVTKSQAFPNLGITFFFFSGLEPKLTIFSGLEPKLTIFSGLKTKIKIFSYENSNLSGMLNTLMQLKRITNGDRHLALFVILRKKIVFLTLLESHFGLYMLLEPFEETKLLKLGSHLEKINCPAPSLVGLLRICF